MLLRALSLQMEPTPVYALYKEVEVSK